MRIVVATSLVLAALSSLVGCGSSDECSPVEVTGEGEAAAGTASCAMQIAIGDSTYSPSCTPVRHDALGEFLVEGDHVGQHIEARLLEGIPQEQAVALRMRSLHGPQVDEGRCGRWSLALAFGLDRSAEKSLARSVAAEAPAKSA
jgi:hypothetical protein